MSRLLNTVLDLGKEFTYYVLQTQLS